MQLVETALPDLLVLESRFFTDERGYFFESYHKQRFEAAVGRPIVFVQDNWSRSRRHVVRGLHYQIQHAQGKLVRVVSGRVFDVAVDLRRQSSTFGRWAGFELSSEDHRALWIPEGFAHGFLAISESADVLYKTTDYYAPEHERTIRWDDGDLAIDWPLTATPVVSAKDRAARSFREAEVFE
jgi:dTDP-4-dehydrorhamnose 3,5-epimerase